MYTKIVLNVFCLKYCDLNPDKLSYYIISPTFITGGAGALRASLFLNPIVGPSAVATAAFVAFVVVLAEVRVVVEVVTSVESSIIGSSTVLQ